MIRLLISCLFFCCIQYTSQAQSAFPYSWEGQWEGVLHWYKGADTVPQKVKMQLRIAPSDTLKNAWAWQLIYGDAGADNRPYHLLPKDTSKGHWVIDEHNGIILDQYLVAGRLNGAFTVQQSTLVNSYYRQGDKLIVEFYSLGAKPISETGHGTADSPKVQSYKIGGYQRAELFRKP